MSETIVIVSATRTPMGSFQGDFAPLSANDLGGAVIKAAVRQVLVPLPLTQRIGGAPLTDGPLLEWVEALVTRILTPFRE